METPFSLCQSTHSWSILGWRLLMTICFALWVARKSAKDRPSEPERPASQYVRSGRNRSFLMYTGSTETGRYLSICQCTSAFGCNDLDDSTCVCGSTSIGAPPVM